MPNHVKSLVLISQEILTNNIDGLGYVGSVPYSLLRPCLKKATPQQLSYIERLNPHLVPESDELWLRHMSIFKDLLEAYHQGEHQDSSHWRRLYFKRYQENERRKKIISEKVKSQYNKIQDEKAARSIKVLKSVVRGRTHDSRTGSSSSSSSRLFLQTKKAASKTNAIYRSHVSHNTYNTIINISKPPSQLAKSYQMNRARYGPPPPPPSLPSYSISHILPPPPNALGNRTSTCGNQRQKASTQSSKSTSSSIQTKKPVALVNYNIFDELG